MSRRIKLALIAVGILAIALAVFFLLLNPMRGDIDELRSSIDDEDMKIMAATQELARAEQTQREGRRNQGRLLELAKMIPSEPEVPSLILQIQDLADKAGIDWIQVSPSQPSFIEGLGYGTLSLSLDFSGTFYDVSDFIYRAEQMVAGPGRLLAVRDVTLSPVTAGGGSSTNLSLDVRMSIWAFVMAPQAEPQPAAPAETPEGGETTETTEAAQ
jgi:Tfp pilus assembly protein PilO